MAVKAHIKNLLQMREEENFIRGINYSNWNARKLLLVFYWQSPLKVFFFSKMFSFLRWKKKWIKMTSNILKYRTNCSREWSWSHWSQLRHSLWHCRIVPLLRNNKEMRYFKERGLKWTGSVGLFCKNTLEPLLSSQKVHWKERN